MEAKEAREAQEATETVGRTTRSGSIRHYKDLLVFQQAYQLAREVSAATKTFPKEEQYELGRQLRSSARSIAANIVEGWAKRESAAEFKRHLQIARGECEETRFWLELAADEACAPRKVCEQLSTEYAKVGMMLYKLWKEWRKLS